MSVVGYVTSLLLVTAVAFASGCAGSSEPALGTISINLEGQATSGAVYRLRNATITVTGPGSVLMLHTEDDPDQTQISVDAIAGNYSALVQDGWTLERVDGSSATTVDAELVSPNPQEFTVVTDQRTTVALQFRVGDVGVDTGSGYDIVLTIDETPRAGLVVANISPPQIAVFAADDVGNVVPRRVIAGASTTLTSPQGVIVTGSEIIVSDPGSNAIDVFPLEANGDVAPLRQIAGSATTLAFPQGLAVLGEELFVIQQNGPPVVFPLHGSGNIAPLRTFSMDNSTDFYGAIDNGELYVTNIGGTVQVYPATGGPMTSRTRFFGPPFPGGPTINKGIVIRNGEVLVANEEDAEILVFPETASGNLAPLRTIAGSLTGFTFLEGLAVSQDELFVTNLRGNAVEVFPINGNGNIAPTRSITGPATGLTSTGGVFTF